MTDASQKLQLYRRVSRVETPGQVAGLEAELRDRYGPLPAEVVRLLTASRLRLLGSELGVERILVRGETARVTFAPDVTPRLTALQHAFHDQQVEVEVRRASPLSLVLRRGGARAIADTVAEALEMLAAKDRARAA